MQRTLFEMVFLLCATSPPFGVSLVVVRGRTHQYYAMTPVAALAQDSSLLWGLGPGPG